MKTDESIGEVVVQSALVASIIESPFLRDRILAEAALDAWRDNNGGVFRSATRSVREPDGESDIVAEWSDSSGGIVRLLIEVKLNAQFMDRQGERYKARSERAMSQQSGLKVITILLAPQQYLRVANPQFTYFDNTISIEALLDWDVANSEHLFVVKDAVTRLAEGRPLGAKGLYQKCHVALASECYSRGNGFQVTNHATDWVTLKYSGCPVGMNLNYRIGSGVVEIRVLSSYDGDRGWMAALDDPAVKCVPSGGELFLKNMRLRVSDQARKGYPTQPDITAIVDALEHLRQFWHARINATPHIA